MKKFSAVIYTPGRTGSHLIIANLWQHYQVDIYSDLNTDATHGLIHSHNPLYVPANASEFVAIISRRHNIFESILSTELAKSTNEFAEYTDKKIAPRSVDITDFKHCYFFQKAFYLTIDTSKYTKVIDVFYEDLISNPDCLLEDLGIKIDPTLSQKSPYNYYDLITNIDELQDIYRELEQQPIKSEKIFEFKGSGIQDLMIKRTKKR